MAAVPQAAAVWAAFNERMSNASVARFRVVYPDNSGQLGFGFAQVTVARDGRMVADTIVDVRYILEAGALRETVLGRHRSHSFEVPGLELLIRILFADMNAMNPRVYDHTPPGMPAHSGHVGVKLNPAGPYSFVLGFSYDDLVEVQVVNGSNKPIIFRVYAVDMDPALATDFFTVTGSLTSEDEKAMLKILDKY